MIPLDGTGGKGKESKREKLLLTTHDGRGEMNSSMDLMWIKDHMF